MNWYERMNNAINYIEENLTGQIDFDVISKITYHSAVNFQRTFSIVTDIMVNEYIRRRRRTLAAFEMQNGKSQADIRNPLPLLAHKHITTLRFVS